ncbi:MAG: peptide-methionine (S)-S-oxide reductase MsrA [Thiolinea sp.]
MSLFSKDQMIAEQDALPGRNAAMPVPDTHFVNGHPLKPPYPQQMQQAVFGMGCFWGVERLFWQLEGVYVTAAGYAAGYTPNPNYQEVCTGRTGHYEVVLVVFDPGVMAYTDLLKVFWESHDPTQGMRQGNDRGTQYRSGIYTFSAEQQAAAEQSLLSYQQALHEAGMDSMITTEILPAPPFYYAEDYHQQYLAKNPGATAVCKEPAYIASESFSGLICCSAAIT